MLKPSDMPLPTRLLLLPALLLLALAGCAPTTDELLPIPASIKGASTVTEVEVVVMKPAQAAVARLNGTAPSEPAQTAPVPTAAPPQVPFEQMLADAIREATRSRGLTSGRALKLRVEIERLQTANAASAMIGRDDRLEGSVFVRDAATGEGLGQLYITIVNVNGGLMSVLKRLGGIREQLSGAFASDIADALSAPGSRRR